MSSSSAGRAGRRKPIRISTPPSPIPEAQITAAIDKVDGIAQDVMSHSGVPGMAVAVVHGGKVVFAKGYGVREVGKPDLVDENTVFQLASVSKSIGSTVVAHAVSDGIVKWSDPVVKYLPDFQLSDPAVTEMVTIGDLYSHRSGIPTTAGDDLEGIGFTREQIIEKLRLFPLNPFRVSYGYTNFGMTTGGEAVAAAAGMPWEDLSAKELYEPLGMTSTSSTYADFLARPDRTTLHFNDSGTFKPLYIRDADAQSPAGGVSSNVTDLAKWMNMNLAAGEVDGQQLIDAEALQAAHTPQITSAPAKEPDARSRFYGYGFNVETTSTGHVKWGHSGAFYVGAGHRVRDAPGRRRRHRGADQRLAGRRSRDRDDQLLRPGPHRHRRARLARLLRTELSDLVRQSTARSPSRHRPARPPARAPPTMSAPTPTTTRATSS